MRNHKTDRQKRAPAAFLLRVLEVHLGIERKLHLFLYNC